MIVKKIETILGATKIENLEEIARKISAPSQSEYDMLYATEIARQKFGNKFSRTFRNISFWSDT